MNECMEVMARTLASLARGEAELPLRTILWLPERIGAFALMPGVLLADKVVGAKVVTFFYGNQGTELDSHQGAVLLFEAERGQLLAVIDATSVTAIRTAAVSGVGDASPGARGRARAGADRLGRPGAHAPGSDADRAADPASPGREQRLPTCPPVRRARVQAPGHRGRTGRLGARSRARRRHRLHRDFVARAGRRRRMARSRDAFKRRRLLDPVRARGRHGRGRPVAPLRRPPRVHP